MYITEALSLRGDFQNTSMPLDAAFNGATHARS